MATCTDCAAELQPEWKFCIRCGARVTAIPAPDSTAAFDTSDTMLDAPDARDESISAGDRPSPLRLNLPMFAGIALALVAVVFVVYMVVVLSSDITR